MRKHYLKRMLSMALLAVLGASGNLLADDYFLEIPGTGTNSVYVDPVPDAEHEYVIEVTGGDPYMLVSPLTRDLTDKEVILKFDYQLTNSISNELEFFWCHPTQGPTGGKSTNFGGLEATADDEWATFTYDITAARAAQNWGAEGDYVRFDVGNPSAGTIMRVRNMRICAIDYDTDAVEKIGTAEELEAFIERVNSGQTRINAELTADIDYSGHTGMMSVFSGTFDGQNHIITVDYTRDADNAALFNDVNMGTVKNLAVDGTITTSRKYAAGIAAHTHSATIINCVSLVDIVSTIEGDATHAGIVAVVETSTTVENCVFAGSITSGTSTNSGGICGWAAGQLTAKNCLMIADIDMPTAGSATICRNLGSVQAINCYYLNAFGDVNVGATKVTLEQLQSGEVCYRLNGNKSSETWFQTLGELDYPLPFTGYGVVYAVGALRCDGMALGGVTYSNTEGTATIPPHTIVDGVCSVCNHLDENYLTVDAEGFYNISTPGELIWFSTMVNGGNTRINGRLTQNIDFEGVDNFTPIGDASNFFRGTFDGQGHRLSNLTIEFPEMDGVGLFGYIANPATIQNLVLDATCSIFGNAFVGIVGETASGQSGEVYLTNLGNEGNITSTNQNAGGILGCCNGSSATIVMTRCYSTGEINGGRETAALSGWFGNAGRATDCWSSANVTGFDNAGSYMGRGTCAYNNCFCTAGSQTTIIPADAPATGELCYRLNGGNMIEPAWYQTIPDDPHPVLDSTHGLVYKIGDNEYGSITDQSSFLSYRNSLIQADQEYLSEVIATQELIDEYTDALSLLAEITDRDEFIMNYDDLRPLMQEIKTSERAYAAYQAEADRVRGVLAEDQSFAGPARNFLEDYLEGDDEPGDDYPNGAFFYIIDNHLLSQEEIEAETTYLTDLLAKAISEGYSVGSDITNLLTNADFSDGFNAWEGTVATGFGGNGQMRAAESYNKNFDMYQTITGLTNGVYELQVNGAFRPAGDRYSTNYAAMIYANDEATYLQSVIEGMILADEAEDGVNCYITAHDNVPDLPVWGDGESTSNDEEEPMGYVLHGVQSCAYAFQAGRCTNTILCNVTDGTLTVGIKSEGTGRPYDWTGFGNIHVYYRGSLDEANAALDNVLAGDIARANTLLAYECYIDESYAQRPNFSNEIRQGLQAAIAAAESASTAEQKYAIVGQFTDLFKQVYECKKVYRALVAKWEKSYGQLSQGELSDEERDALEARNDNIWNGYIDGTFTQAEAEALIAALGEEIPNYLVLSETVANHSINLEATAPFTYLVECTGSDPYIGVAALEQDLSSEQNYLTFEYRAPRAGKGEFFYATPSRGFTGGIEMWYDEIPAATEWTRHYIDFTEAREKFGWGATGDYLRWDPIQDGSYKIEVRCMLFVSYDELQQLLTGIEVTPAVVDMSKANTNVYDMNGRLVRLGSNLQNLPAGLYIVAGRKVMVK